MNKFRDNEQTQCQLDQHGVTSLPEILTMEEAATWLRCSKAHLSHAINGRLAGLPRLPSLPVGRRRMIRRETLMKWTASIATIDAQSNGRNSSPVALPERRH
jgi:hypothetical protein